MDDKELENLQAEEQLAITDPQAYFASNPTPRDWNLTTQEIAKSISIDPIQVFKETLAPRNETWFETVGRNLWEGFTNSPIKENNMSRYLFSSPNMTKEEAERWMQDVIYTDYLRRQAETANTAQKVKYKNWGEFANAAGYMIKLALMSPIPGLSGVVAGGEAAAQTEMDLRDRYVEKHGTADSYDKAEMWKDSALATASGIFMGATEEVLGVQSVIRNTTSNFLHIPAAARLARMQGKRYKSGALKAANAFIVGGGGEALEEMVQNPAEAGFTAMAGYADQLSTDEEFNKTLKAMLFAIPLGGAVSWGAYRYNRAYLFKQIDKWNKENNVGLTDQQVVEMGDEIIDNARKSMLDEMSTRVEIRNKYGQAYDLVKKRLLDQIDATGTVPWRDKAKTKEEYVQVLADTLTIPSINVANKLNIPLQDFLEIADVEAWVVGNIIGFSPIRSVADIDAIIAKQDATIKDQREKKKLGIDNEKVLNDAKSRKAQAERVRREVIQNQEMTKRSAASKKQISDYMTAKEAQPASVEGMSAAVTAKPNEDYVLFAGKKIPVEYQVVELSTVQPSHINGVANPNYTNEQLQNRASRGTQQDVADLREKAQPQNFTPERLMRNVTSAEGAPIINEKGEVIAGNGRAEIVRYAYETPESAEKYKKSLRDSGFNIEGMQQPILVRRNTTMTPDEQIAAADLSNISETSAFDEASQARRDTQYLKDSKDSVDFANKLPMSDRRGLMQNNGKWNKRRVQQRYESALLSWLCGNDTQLFENLVLDRGIGQKVIDILTTNGNLIYETATKYPELGIREDIYNALVKMQTTNRDNFIEMTQQLSLDGHDVMPENIMVWNWLFTDSTTNRQFMQQYMNILAKNQEKVAAGEDMFGQKDAPLSKKDALMQALKKADEAKAELATSRNRQYEPLFDENGQIKNLELSAAIVSYQNQFAPTSNLNQRVFVSMKGAMEGEYLDADRFLGKGDNTRVWLWGNYTLLSEKIDKEHYYDRFERYGPDLTYNGDEVTDKFLEAGFDIVHPSVQRQVKDFAQTVGQTKEKLVEAVKRNVKNEEDNYKKRVSKVLRRFVPKQMDRAKANEILHDLEAIALTPAGRENGLAIRFGEGTKAAEIQNKYRDTEGKLDDNFVNLYLALVDEFEREGSMYAVNNNFIGHVNRLDGLKRSLEGVKKLNWKKFSGQTGFLYKGKDAQVELSTMIRNTGLWEHARNNVYMDVEDALKNALNKNQDIQVALSELGKEYSETTALIPQAEKAIANALDKAKSEYPDADVQAVSAYLNSYMTSPQQSLVGYSPSIIMSMPLSFSSQEDQLIRKALRMDDHGIELKHRWTLEVTPTLADVIYKIKEARTHEVLLNYVRNQFKDATNADFIYKPRASMYAAEAPENDILLNASRDLTKQPKKVQEAIIKTIREYGNKYPKLGLLNNLRNPIVTKSKAYDSETGQELLRAFGFPFYDSIETMAKDLRNNTLPDQVKDEYSNLDVEERIWNYMAYAVESAYEKTSEPTIKDLKEGLEAQYRHYADSPYNNSFEPYRNLHNSIVEFLKKGLDKQNNSTKLSDFFGRVQLELAPRNAFTFLSGLVNQLKIFPETQKELAKDKSLKLTANPPADEIIIKMFRKNGIEGLKYYGRRDKHGIVTWDKTPVKERLYSLDLTNRLVVTHGISAANLEKAFEIGGFPVPSIGISRATDPLTDFGPIKLVGTSDMIDPANPNNLVYDRDIWSQRVPRPTYKNATWEDRNKFKAKFEETFNEVGEGTVLSELLHTALNTSRPEEAIDRFANSLGAQVYYIRNVLHKDIDIPLKKRDELPGVYYIRPDHEFLKQVSKINPDESYDSWEETYKKAVLDLIERGGIGSEYKYSDHADKMIAHIKEYYEKLHYEQARSQVQIIQDFINKKEEVDQGQLSGDIYNYYDLFGKGSKYPQWAAEQTKDLLGEPKIKVGKRLLDWNIENITKAMTKGNVVVGKETSDVRVGTVIASGAQNLETLSAIKERGQQLQTKDAADATTTKVGMRITRFVDDIIKLGYSEFDRNNIHKALAKLAQLPDPKPSNVQKLLMLALEDAKLQLDEKMLQEGVDIAKEIQNITRYYFEAKPQRAVSFDEFVGAIVPTDEAYDESADQLEARGLTVVRSDDTKQGMAEMAAIHNEILMQNRRALVRGSYDPELQTIILNKNWNEMTLVHEFHHRFLELLWGYFKQAQMGDRIVSQEFMTDMDRLFRMLDIDQKQAQLSTVQQEKFTYMVEAYLTGLGVDNVDNLAFQSFLHWVPEQYKSIMDLGYLDENNNIQNPMLDEESIAWFNKWFASPFAPSLPSAPDAQRLVNPTDENGEIIASDQKTMNNREKEWGQDSEQQLKADAQLWRAIDENTPNDMRAAIDGEKEIMKVEGQNQPDDTKLPEPPKQTFREKWFKARVKDARERAAEMAREYVAKNPDHARELAFADPETMVEYDAPVDQGMLIRAVMETVPHGSEEWYLLDNNLAMVKSMSGSTLALSGDQSHQAYLDAKREIEAARELKAAVNYAGTRRGAIEKWDSDIRAFIATRTAAIVATEPDSEERKAAIKAFLEEAKTKFSANTTNAVLNQLDLTGMRTRNSQVFIKWAENQIKQATHAHMDVKEQQELMKASIAAQLALKEIDSRELKDGKYVRAVQSGKDIQHWQYVKDKMKKAYIGRWGKFGIFVDNLFGGYMPSAMLMSANTLFFANVPSTAINTATIRIASKGIGKNMVDEQVQKDEIHRIKQIFNATGMNLAQMDKPTSPSTLHGEKYMNTEQKHWYNFTFEILGRTDNEFRVPTFVDTLARIATKNANGDKARATALFKEYCRLNTTSDEAKIARKQALAVANMAVFTQDGTMASALNHIRSSLNTITRAPLGLEPNGFGLGTILAPFLKTGVNITEMGLNATFAPLRTAIMGMKKLQGKQIPEIDKIALRSDWINLAWMSVVLAVLAMINSDDDKWYEEPYQTGRTYDPNKPYDSIRFGDVWVKLDIFGPLAIPLRAALKMVQEWEKKKLEAVADGLFFGGMEALSETPLVQQFTDSSLDYMTKKSGAYWSGFGYNQLNKFVPAQAKTLSRAISRGANVSMDADWMGKTISRKFHRNYGLDGARLTTNDLINILTNRLKYNPK